MPYANRAYEVWAPVVGRVLFAIPFAVGAWFKMPWMFYNDQVAQSAAVGIPMPEIAVALAAILEIALALMFLFGYYTRLAGFVGALYVLLLAAIFYNNWADMMVMGAFISHLSFVAGLLYVSVYGAKHAALKKD
jgi:putative oxidoreductase